MPSAVRSQITQTEVFIISPPIEYQMNELHLYYPNEEYFFSTKCGTFTQI